MPKEHGAILVDGVHVASTYRCVHCGMHWQGIKGSGIRRGFCLSCMGQTCGARLCDRCVPFEKKLDLYEKGKLYSL